MLKFPSGFYDPMILEYIRLLRKQIPSSKSVLFVDSAHMPHIEEEETYSRTVQEFLLESEEKPTK